MANRYRKLPVEVEAMQLDGTLERAQEVLAWVAGEAAVTIMVPSHGLLIETLEGEHEALPTDWIIEGVAGEFYPCKPDIFAQTYEPVDD